MQQITDQHEAPLPPADPLDQPPPPLPLSTKDEEDDPDQILLRAVAEIDTQPLPAIRRDPLTRGEILDTCLLVGVLLLSMTGIVWRCLTLPHVLVIVYAKTTPASLTTTLPLFTRALAPVTLTRSATTPTTGTGHQDATHATGTLIFYNGGAAPYLVPGGSIFTGNDDVQVTVDRSLIVPAANLPAIGSISVAATALLAGRQGNIATWDINRAISPDVKVRNEAPFSHGRDVRTYRAVAQADLDRVTTTVSATLTQAFASAFPLRPGEQALPTLCYHTTTASHAAGEEATSVSVTSVQTCAALAYQHQQLASLATAAFTHTRPGVSYHLVDGVQTTVERVSPFTVTLSGRWVYTFSPDYQEFLAERIAGDSPAKARAFLLHTGVIASASVPGTLPPVALYIDFVVLVK